MSIIGEDLPGYVRNQINVRQLAHGSGVSEKRTQDQLTYLNSRTAWIKLASGNYISPEKIKELELPVEFVGTGLAKNHILFGGFSSIIDNYESDSFSLQQRTGFIENYFTDNSYEIGKDFGIVPMPGITSLDVKALNRGSLKKAILKFKVQNRDQLTIIDTLYLRLGYTVLLEWGNSIFLDNNGEIQKVQDTILENKQLFFNPSWTQQAYDDVLGEIENLRNTYQGNYDGILGKVSNFNWLFNKDGSYDVELTIISYGDVIESLKTNITATKETYDFVNEQSINTHAGRTIQDHRSDNILFTILHAFKIMAPKDTSKSVEVDGTKYGWFIQKGAEEIKSDIVSYPFEATHTLYRWDPDAKTEKPVNSNEFKLFSIDYGVNNGSEDNAILGDTSGTYRSRYKDLISNDSIWTGVDLPSYAYHIKGQTWVNSTKVKYDSAGNYYRSTTGFPVFSDSFNRNYYAYPLSHITNGPERFVAEKIDNGGYQFKEKSLGAPGGLDNSMFKLISKGLAITGDIRTKTFSFKVPPGWVGGGTSYTALVEMPYSIWGIQSLQTTGAGDTIIDDGLENNWGQSSGTKWTKTTLTTQFTDPELKNIPQSDTTTTAFKTKLDEKFEKFKEDNKYPKELYEAPEYKADGTPNDSRYEFFHRFVAKSEDDLSGSEYEFFWKTKFENNGPQVIKSTLVKNPLYAIVPYDDRGAIALQTNPEVYYIRFGFLLQIVQDKATLKIDKQKSYAEYDQNTPIFKIAYQTGSFDMLCLPNQMSFDLTKCLVRRDKIEKSWIDPKDPNKGSSKIFNQAYPWYHGDEPTIYTKDGYLNKNVADIMNIYLEIDFVGQCMLAATDERGNMATYSFINNICIGLNKALAGVNNLEPVIDETTNTLYILDSSPKYDYRKEKQGNYELQLYGYQEYKGQKDSESTFARKVDLKTAITPEYATMITIGATAGGYAKGIEATAFAKWNYGILDRFKVDFIPGDKELATGSINYRDDIIASYQNIMQDTKYALGIVGS